MPTLLTSLQKFRSTNTQCYCVLDRDECTYGTVALCQRRRAVEPSFWQVILKGKSSKKTVWPSPIFRTILPRMSVENLLGVRLHLSGETIVAELPTQYKSDPGFESSRPTHLTPNWQWRVKQCNTVLCLFFLQ